MKKIQCQECGFLNRIWSVTCESCRANLYEQTNVSPPCEETPPVAGNGHDEEMKIPEDAEIVDENTKPKVIILRFTCPNCGNNSLVYNNETQLFECCLSEDRCGAIFALSRVYDEQLVS